MNSQQRIELAQKLFREYRPSCFWSCKLDLVITEALVPFVAEGLREHGGHKGFLAAGPLRRAAAG